MNQSATLKAALNKHLEPHTFKTGDVVTYKRGFSPPYRTHCPLIIVRPMTEQEQADYAKSQPPGKYEREDVYAAGYSNPLSNPMNALKKNIVEIAGGGCCWR